MSPHEDLLEGRLKVVWRGHGAPPDHGGYSHAAKDAHHPAVGNAGSRFLASDTERGLCSELQPQPDVLLPLLLLPPQLLADQLTTLSGAGRRQLPEAAGLHGVP